MQLNNKLPLIAILRGIRPEEVIEHVQAIIDAGFEMVEVPLNSPQWEISIEKLVNAFGEQVMIGAGTVLQLEQVTQLAEIGCKLIVTPNTNPALIQYAISKNMLVCAGCATVTEAFNAIDAGTTALKIFPSSAFGPSYIQALKAVLPAEYPVFAVGGVTPENLKQWLDAGCIGAGLGGDLYRSGQSVDVTAQKARAFVKAYKEGSKQ